MEPMRGQKQDFLLPCLIRQMDVVDSATRSRMMRGIGSKNSLAELHLRSLLHKLGFRFRLHRRDLQGCPDLVLKKHGCLIFVNGCFWHGHEGCRYFKYPKSNSEFWRNKIQANVFRDKLTIKALLAKGWRVCVLWECMTRSKLRLEEVGRIIPDWLLSRRRLLELPKKGSDY